MGQHAASHRSLSESQSKGSSEDVHTGSSNRWSGRTAARIGSTRQILPLLYPLVRQRERLCESAARNTLCNTVRRAQIRQAHDQKMFAYLPDFRNSHLSAGAVRNGYGQAFRTARRSCTASIRSFLRSSRNPAGNSRHI